MEKTYILTGLTAILMILNSNAMAEDVKTLETATESEGTTPQKIVPPVELKTVMNAYVPEPQQVAGVQLSANKRIQYMIDNYTTPQLAQQAVQLNQAEINQARISGQKPPAKLTRAILDDREKIADYLREHYKFKY
ncbi:MAG: hypothetical protein VZR95_04590 [Alphaproteobacteria bacterium]